MLGIAMYNTIETLYKRGFNKSEIARMTGHDWKTVSKVIKVLQKGKSLEKKPHPHKLEGYKEMILKWLESNVSGIRIHELLKEQGILLSYSTVKLYLREIKTRQEICIRFHTAAGEEAQVDFGYVGKLPDSKGKIRKAWVFNMRLSFSRLDYYEIVFDQKVETFIQCHIHAFQYFQGVPRVVRIDNLKAAVLEAHFYQPLFQTLYKQFADYYQFQIIPCRVRKPQEKGKVESGIKYIKNNFFSGRHFKDNTSLKSQLRNWLENVCNRRVHGTTRKVPKELFEAEEKNALISLPIESFYPPVVGQRLIYKDCHAYIDYNYYSVPYTYVGRTVDIEVSDQLVTLFYEGKQIALHARLVGKGQFSTQESHYPPYKLVFSTDNQKEYEKKMQSIGEEAHRLFCFVLKNQPHRWLQTIKGILSLRKKFTDEIINLSCHRALSYGAIQYRQLKSICESGCYRLPIDQEERVH
jgi:transposase